MGCAVLAILIVCVAPLAVDMFRWALTVGWTCVTVGA